MRTKVQLKLVQLNRFLELEQLDLTREGGHSQRRILHVQDHTGRAIQDALPCAGASASSDSYFRKAHGDRFAH